LKPSDFISLARLIITSGNGKPSQVALRRAVSTAYYGVFHSLASCGADLLIGGRGALRSDPAWRQVYRALDHGAAKSACSNNKMMQRFPKEIVDFANVFVTMQEKRHKADYDPTARFAKSSVTFDIDASEQAIADLAKAERRDQSAFAALVLLKNRT
jgi:uncharacterized protein (UPF0332 family)